MGNQRKMLKNENINILSRIGTLDRRYMWWTITILVALVLINPIGLPVKPSESTIAFKEVIDTLPTGSIVLMEFSSTAASWDEIRPGAFAVAAELLEGGHKLITLGVNEPEAPIFAQLTFESTGWTEKATKGVDYVNLGLISGGETTVFNLARDFQMAEKDVDGVPISELELTKDIKDANDIDLIIDIHSAAGVVTWYLRHWVVPYGNKMLTCITSASVYSVVPYWESGELLGYLGGQKGISEYEFLSGRPGEAIRSVDAQSLINFFFIGVVVLGTVVEIMERGKR